MFDAEDEWIPAINALISRSRPDRKLAKILKNEEPPPPGFSKDHMIPDPDPKPLADMFRTGRPVMVPVGICDVLAELLDPGDPEYLGCKLILKDTGAIEKNLRTLDTVRGRKIR